MKRSRRTGPPATEWAVLRLIHKIGKRGKFPLCHQLIWHCTQGRTKWLTSSCVQDQKVEKTICPEHGGECAGGSQLPPVGQTTKALSKDWDTKLLWWGGGRVQERQSTSITQSLVRDGSVPPHRPWNNWLSSLQVLAALFRKRSWKQKTEKEMRLLIPISVNGNVSYDS